MYRDQGLLRGEEGNEMKLRVKHDGTPFGSDENVPIISAGGGCPDGNIR